ncbi:tetratricopeptide repeat protein [uncultured Clostridium sp.]|uniref:tetratricopeptide repeat protein n=1 Tax=uncultured Clostridium sp. TaxID=59620 RepID=UPI002582586A|nr:tetratricopeptide repeat protein [uncultured Clostridium sp.]
MKEVKGLFSRVNKSLKSFFLKVKKVLKPVYKTLNDGCKKLADKYRKANMKNKYVEPVIVITTSCIFVLIMILTIKGFTTVEEVNITKNSGEQLYYQSKYDEAIEEYKKMQEKDTWPEWTVKIADIYSLRGETKKSSTLLKEAIVKRDKVIKDEGYNKFKDKDVELINSMLRTFTLNNEYDEAISFGEQYISDYGKSKDILKTLFMAYISNNYIYKAEELTENYPLDEKSSYDISVLANMNMLINRWDKGLELLKSAWELDKNELKIYYVIESIYEFDKDSLIKELETKIKESNDDAYKVFLANVYAMNAESANKAFDLIEEIDSKGINNIGIDYIKYKISKNLNNKDEAIAYLDDAINKSKVIDKESYTTFYLLSLKALNNNKYDEALSYAKKSINANNKYAESYGILIPEILINKNNFNSIEAYYREAIKKEPYNYELIIKLADYYTSYVSNNEKAKYYYGIALKFNKDNPIIYSKMIDIYIKDNKIDEAIEKLEEAIKVDESNQDYYRMLGALYFEKGMNDKGIELTRKAYSMNEKDPISLNNAAWYYIMVENDIARGYDNLKAAYEDISAGLDEEIKTILIENYNKVKKVYEEFLNDNSKEFDKKGIKLIY